MRVSVNDTVVSRYCSARPTCPPLRQSTLTFPPLIPYPRTSQDPATAAPWPDLSNAGGQLIVYKSDRQHLH